MSPVESTTAYSNSDKLPSNDEGLVGNGSDGLCGCHGDNISHNEDHLILVMDNLAAHVRRIMIYSIERSFVNQIR